MRFWLALLLLLPALSAHAWNAAGHRLVAVLAWPQLAPATQTWVARTLNHHPDAARWREKAGSDMPALLLAEAATWADEIRNDPRFHDPDDPPTAPPPGLPDAARHRNWHYIDLDATGRAVDGELDLQIERLSRLLQSSRRPGEQAWALVWLVHLVADLHQPLHVGRAGDQGGNAFAIENPLDPKRPFTDLHRFWDELPGSNRLRGQRLQARAAELAARHQAADAGTVADWRDESHALHGEAYPQTAGSLLPIVTPAFHHRARDIADAQLVRAAARLARLLNQAVARRVSRETD